VIPIDKRYRYAIIDKMMVIDWTSTLVKCQYSKQMDDTLLGYFDRIERSINEVYFILRKKEY